jgi:hypothetical protein
MHLCVGMSEERGNKLILCGVHISLAPLTLVGGGGGGAARPKDFEGAKH